MPADGEKQGADLERPIAVLRLSLRATNCLRSRGIWKLGQLIELTENESSLRRGFDRDIVNEIQLALRKWRYWRAEIDEKRGISSVRKLKGAACETAKASGRRVSQIPAPRAIQAKAGKRPSQSRIPQHQAALESPAPPVGLAWQGNKNEVRLYWVDNRWVVRLEVTGKMLRGGSRALPGTVGKAIGCQPRTAMWLFRTRIARLVVSWPPDRPSGPYLGSIDRDLDALGAREGDLAFLAFDRDKATVTLLRTDELRTLPALEKVARLVGLPAGTASQSDAWRMIGAAIGIPLSQAVVSADDVHLCLMRRGEDGLAGLVRQAPANELSILDELEGILGL